MEEAPEEDDVHQAKRQAIVTAHIHGDMRHDKETSGDNISATEKSNATDKQEQTNVTDKRRQT